MLTQQRLKELLHYDPVTGVITRNGKSAGFRNDRGYIIIKVDGYSYKAHRLAWLYMTGGLTAKEIDHINGVTDDNRWNNLRDAEHCENSRNRKLNKDNKSGFKGVYWLKKQQRWRAVITFDQKKIHLGCYDDPKEAHEAYCIAAKKYHKEFVRTETMK
jgi:hypothetical protein